METLILGFFFKSPWQVVFVHWLLAVFLGMFFVFVLVKLS